ncbi:replication initiation protein [Fictibacillus sp. KIGAM418]|uniref:Replication initiation protein n=1 Tax=Fictibacillus marinisediminis TaxID=2878389 RepID=A0A9X2BG99_9BACL|nr:replication initiation protein [Fictibacillus marinisediminis]MCK6259585.1 replication initiation protein [Fictibacillus marinisediminis]
MVESTVKRAFSDSLSLYDTQTQEVREADKLSGYNWVTKSNALIEKTYQLSVMEQKLILTLASLVQPSDEAFRPYQIKVSDFVHLLGLKSTGKYTEIRKIVQGLQQKTLPINTGQSTLDITWLSSAEYFHGKGYVELEFSPKLKPYLLQLKQKFTTYQLKNIIQLRSSYSIRIYELLKQYEPLRQRSFTLEELRSLLGIEPNKYKLFGHFKDKVLNVANKELEEKTDLRFEYEEIKVGRKVSSIKFSIYKNQAKHKGVQLSGDLEFEARIQESLERMGLSKPVIKSLISDYGYEQIDRNLEYSKKIIEKRKIESPIGFLVQSIKDDYANNQVKEGVGLPSYLSEQVKEEKIKKMVRFSNKLICIYPEYQVQWPLKNSSYKQETYLIKFLRVVRIRN